MDAGWYTAWGTAQFSCLWKDLPNEVQLTNKEVSDQTETWGFPELPSAVAK